MTKEPTMIAYHGNPKLKAEVLAGLAWHREQDRILRGRYWNDETRRGCAIGCTLETLRKINGWWTIDHDRHDLYPLLLGVGTDLAQLEDKIFEGLTLAEALTWPERFAAAIPVGADTSLVVPRFLRDLLANPDGAVQRALPAGASRTRAAVDAVVRLYDRLLAGDPPTQADWRAAEEAAAEAAAWSAWAVAAAWAAAAEAARAAWAAARAAATNEAEYARQAEALLTLLAAAPVPGADDGVARLIYEATAVVWRKQAFPAPVVNRPASYRSLTWEEAPPSHQAAMRDIARSVRLLIERQGEQEAHDET